MEQNTDSTRQRFPSLGKLSLAIIEHLVEKVVGKAAVEETKKPYAQKEIENSLSQALATVEADFITQYTDQDVCDALLQLPIHDLLSTQTAIWNLYERPNDGKFAEFLISQLKLTTRLNSSQINEAVTFYMKLLRREFINTSSELREKLQALTLLEMADSLNEIKVSLGKREVKFEAGRAPLPPAFVVGRERDLQFLKEKLIKAVERNSSAIQILIAIRGWPGVGKTTLASALASDPDIKENFPDGILWISLGDEPNILSTLITWGRALGIYDLNKERTVEDASSRLAAIMRDKRVFLIIDDVWKQEHAQPLRVGGPRCATLITTRATEVAQALATPEDIYLLNILTEEESIELLRKLAPSVVNLYLEECRILVQELEGLPLALHVAGHMLNAEASSGFTVVDLLQELRSGRMILEAKAPTDRMDLANGTTPTVAVLLQKSTDRLNQYTKDCFAYLGAFAPKPATFDLAAMKSVWHVDDPKPIVKTLVDRGLLESVPAFGRYQMHALLVAHAKSLLEP